jgi:hypothetical protein
VKRHKRGKQSADVIDSVDRDEDCPYSSDDAPQASFNYIVRDAISSGSYLESHSY